MQSGRLSVRFLKVDLKFIIISGGLAQLAREFDWQSKGHRFDSDILHSDYQDLAATQGLFLCLECTSGVHWSAFFDFLSVIPCDLIL